MEPHPEMSLDMDNVPHVSWRWMLENTLQFADHVIMKDDVRTPAK
jgi:hypothetical protein